MLSFRSANRSGRESKSRPSLPGRRRAGVQREVENRSLKLTSFEALVAALEKWGVRYLAAGGLTVNAHGFLRFTKDIDYLRRQLNTP